MVLVTFNDNDGENTLIGKYNDIMTATNVLRKCARKLNRELVEESKNRRSIERKKAAHDKAHGMYHKPLLQTFNKETAYNQLLTLNMNTFATLVYNPNATISKQEEIETYLIYRDVPKVGSFLANLQKFPIAN